VFLKHDNKNYSFLVQVTLSLNLHQKRDLQLYQNYKNQKKKDVQRKKNEIKKH
jgi:hypothetical protein